VVDRSRLQDISTSRDASPPPSTPQSTTLGENAVTRSKVRQRSRDASASRWSFPQSSVSQGTFVADRPHPRSPAQPVGSSPPRVFHSDQVSGSVHLARPSLSGNRSDLTSLTLLLNFLPIFAHHRRHDHQQPTSTPFPPVDHGSPDHHVLRLFPGTALPCMHLHCKPYLDQLKPTFTASALLSLVQDTRIVQLHVACRSDALLGRNLHSRVVW